MATKPSLEARAKKDPALLRRILANPGLRSKLSDSYLGKVAPDQLKKRRTSARLKQPITPGSNITERDLARDSKAAMTTKYGPLENQQRQALGEEQARTRDVGGFYDQYLRQVAQHAQNIRSIGEAAVQTGLGTQNAITGLSQTGLAGIQNPATADAAGRGAVAGDLSGMASNAAAIRQALVGSFVKQQGGVNAANQGYASTQANVVAPGQKLGAQAMGLGRERQAREDIAATAREKGADDTSYRSSRRSEEAKNVLAGAIANVNAADKAADNTRADTTVTETGRHHRAQETAAEKRAREKREKEAADATAKGQEPNKYGIPTAQWNTWSTSHRQRVIDEFDKENGAKPKDGKGPEWVTKLQSGKAMTQVGGLKQAITDAKSGAAFIPGHAKQKPLDKAGAREKVRSFIGSKLLSPALLDAATDAIYDGFISATTVRALITAGYKPSEIATALGVKTSGQVGPKGEGTYGGPH